MANLLDGIVIGTASAAIAAVLLSKFYNNQTQGGGQPHQDKLHSYTARAGVISPAVPCRLASDAAPLVQNTPITEAAYNLQLTTYAPTLGPDQNAASTELTLPI